MINNITKQRRLLLLLILIIGAFLRFYKLDWGQGLFTHPDEYHIVASVAQLSFPNQMHPHFFSYGTVTIYLIYFTQEILRYISSIFHIPFSIFNAFLVGRFYSALFSTLTIFIVYKICKSFLEKHFSLLAAFLVAITPGLIQQAHFATPESTLTFFLFASLLFIIKFLKQNKILFLLLASVFFGFALGVKTSSIVFLLPLIATIAFRVFPKHHLEGAHPIHLGGGEGIRHSTPPRWTLKQTGLMLKILLKFIGLTIASAGIVVTTFALVAPYVFLDYSAFRSNLDYEGGLAVGKIPVFYTRQFIDTVPILFQAEKILPYALGPVMLIMGILGLLFFVVLLIKNLVSKRHLGWWRSSDFDSSEVDGHLRGVHSATSKVIIIAFLSLFLPNAFLFAKWTRFIAPTFPFFAIFAAFLLEQVANKARFLSYSLTIILLLITSLWTAAFFSIYTNRDIRIIASDWLESHAPEGSTFLVEGGNMIDLPLKGNFPRISLDFYALEDDPATREKIIDALYSSDYFLVQSRRVFMNHQRLPNLYPKTARLYDALFDSRLGFKQVKMFESYPQLQVTGYRLQVPDEGAEETWSVFDHPVIRVFKKNAQLDKESYASFFKL